MSYDATANLQSTELTCKLGKEGPRLYMTGSGGRTGGAVHMHSISSILTVHQ